MAPRTPGRFHKPISPRRRWCLGPRRGRARERPLAVRLARAPSRGHSRDARRQPRRPSLLSPRATGCSRSPRPSRRAKPPGTELAAPRAQARRLAMPTAATITTARRSGPARRHRSNSGGWLPVRRRRRQYPVSEQARRDRTDDGAQPQQGNGEHERCREIVERGERREHLGRVHAHAQQSWNAEL